MPAYAPNDSALAIRTDVAFFQDVRAVLAKHAPGDRRTDEEMDLLHEEAGEMADHFGKKP